MRWTLRQMVLGTLVVALVIPYVRAVWPDQDPPLKHFAISDGEFRRWLIEEDSTIELEPSGYVGIVGPHHLLGRLRIKSSELTSQQLLESIRTKVRAKIKNESWKISNDVALEESVLFEFTDGHSKRYLYLSVEGGEARAIRLISIRDPSY